MDKMPRDKEKKYEILETILLNFNSLHNQYSTLFQPEDDAQVIVDGSEVYLFYKGKRYSTIDGPDLIDLYIERGAVREIMERPDRN
jgi:hypothetical protein